MPLTNFPGSLDVYVNPASGDLLSSVVVPHWIQHSQLNDAVTAIQTKIGIDGSSVTTSFDYLLKNTASVNPGHKHTFGALTDVTLSSPASGEVLYYTGSHWTNSNLTSSLLTGLSISPSSTIASTDTILQAFGKLQAELNTIGVTAAVPTTRTLQFLGTTNQISVDQTVYDLSANRAWTFSLPQNIHTGATPTFKKLTLQTAASGGDGSYLVLDHGDNASPIYIRAGFAGYYQDAFRIEDSYGSQFQIINVNTGSRSILIGGEANSDPAIKVYSPSKATHFYGSTLFHETSYHDNNKGIAWADSGGTNRSLVVLDNSNNTYLGPVATGWGATTYLQAGTGLNINVNGASGSFTTALAITSAGAATFGASGTALTVTNDSQFWGNVGIRRAVGTNPLTIQDTANDAGILIRNLAGTSFTRLAFTGDNTYLDSSGGVVRLSVAGSTKFTVASSLVSTNQAFTADGLISGGAGANITGQTYSTTGFLVNNYQSYKSKNAAGTAVDLFYLDSSNDLWIQMQSGKAVIFDQGGSEAGRFSAGRRFLLGSPTDDGANKLQVTGTSLFTGNVRVTGKIGVNRAPTYALDVSDTGTYFRLIDTSVNANGFLLTPNNGAGSHGFSFYDGNASATRLTINSSGGVNIGSGSCASNFSVGTGTDVVSWEVATTSSTNVFVSAYNRYGGAYGNLYNDVAAFVFRPSSSGSNQIWMTSSGLGVNNNNPLYKIDVVGPGSNVDAMQIQKGSGEGGLRFSFANANHISYIRTYEDNANSYMHFGVASGTSTSVSVLKLFGDGKARFYSDLTVDGALYANSNHCQFYDFTASSTNYCADFTKAIRAVGITSSAGISNTGVLTSNYGGGDNRAAQLNGEVRTTLGTGTQATGVLHFSTTGGEEDRVIGDAKTIHLADVSTTTATTTGQFLRWNQSTTKWEPYLPTCTLTLIAYDQQLTTGDYSARMLVPEIANGSASYTIKKIRYYRGTSTTGNTFQLKKNGSTSCLTTAISPSTATSGSSTTFSTSTVSSGDTLHINFSATDASSYWIIQVDLEVA